MGNWELPMPIAKSNPREVRFMEHPFHLMIANSIQAQVQFLEWPANYVVHFGLDCGGLDENQLFCVDEKSNVTRFSKPDILITRDRELKVIVEIEESGESNQAPVKINGKLMNAICSCCYQDGELKDVWFVQVIQTAIETKKQQCQYIQQKARELLPLGPVINYQIFAATQQDYLHEGEEKFLKHIEEALQSTATR